jgi:hypothetical protein
MVRPLSFASLLASLHIGGGTVMGMGFGFGRFRLALSVILSMPKAYHRFGPCQMDLSFFLFFS